MSECVSECTITYIARNVHIDFVLEEHCDNICMLIEGSIMNCKITTLKGKTNNNKRGSELGEEVRELGLLSK